MNHEIKYRFEAEMWKNAGAGGWHFITLPHDISKEIRQLFQSQEEGWGRLKARAAIGKSEWKTAIWFDTKAKTYLLPVKADIRRKEKLDTATSYLIEIWV